MWRHSTTFASRPRSSLVATGDHCMQRGGAQRVAGREKGDVYPSLHQTLCEQRRPLVPRAHSREEGSAMRRATSIATRIEVPLRVIEMPVVVDARTVRLPRQRGVVRPLPGSGLTRTGARDPRASSPWPVGSAGSVGRESTWAPVVSPSGGHGGRRTLRRRTYAGQPAHHFAVRARVYHVVGYAGPPCGLHRNAWSEERRARCTLRAGRGLLCGQRTEQGLGVTCTARRSP